MAGDSTLENQQQIAEDSVHFGDSVVITPIKENTEPTASNASSNSQKWVDWGKKNDYPQCIIANNLQETTSAGCLNFKHKAHYGQGLIFYRKEDDKFVELSTDDETLDEKYAPFVEFVDNNDLNNYAQALDNDYEWFNNCVTEFIFNNTGKKVNKIYHKDMSFTRAGRMNDKGKIENYYFSAEFAFNAKPSDELIAEVAAIRKDHWDNGKLTEKFKSAFYHHRLYTPGQLYYSTPTWHSNSKFVDLALKVSGWISANLDNSLNIKYHIEYPEAYFEALNPRTRFDSDEKQMAAIKTSKEEYFKKLDDMLSGTKNASKFFASGTVMGPDGKPLIGWKFNELKNETNSDAFLSLYDTTAAANGTAHNVPSSLSGLIVSKSIGAGSGSDVREQFNNYIQLHTVMARQTTLEALYFVKKINGWPKDLQFGYRSIVLETLDKNPTGSKTIVQENVDS